MLKTASLGVAILLGVAMIANGVFMLVSPGDWYLAVPGVTSTGPSVIPRDFPAVTLPAIIGILLTFWAIRQSRGRGAEAV